MKKFKVFEPERWTEFVCLESKYPLPKECRGGLVIDCGSNIGAFELNYGDRFDKFICFDICEENIQTLNNNLKNKDVIYEVYKKACHPEKGKKISVYAHQDQKGSIEYFGNSGNVGIKLYSNNDNSGYFKENKIDEIDSITIEEIVEKYADMKLLKIDIEGAEYDFLQDKDISKIPYIVGEFHFDGKVRNDLLVHISKTHNMIYHSAPVFCFKRRDL